MAAAGVVHATATTAPPNVLLITVDTLRAAHLSAYGYGWKTSPNMDKLAAEGARFERAYTVIPLTGPAHLSLFTSRYPQEHGARRNGVAMGAGRTLVMLPQVLRANGYRSAGFISAWPLIGRLTHLDQWFDYYDEDLNRQYHLFNSSRWGEDVTPRAIEWLEENSNGDKPFFLWVHYFDPHEPYDFHKHFAGLEETGTNRMVAAEDEEMRERVRAYDTEIAYTDWYMGKLFGALDKLKLAGNTLVVLTADHGESLGEHGYVGHGRHLFEDIIRIPLIIRMPGMVKAGTVVQTPVSLLDITPTILDLTIGKRLEETKAPLTFQGRSLAPAMTTNAKLTARRMYYLTFAGKKGFAPNWLSWLWIGEEEFPHQFGYMDGGSKFIWSPENMELTLYDVARDPRELNARLPGRGSEPYKAATARLKTWFKRTESLAGENKLSKNDIEVLKSLGYVQ